MTVKTRLGIHCGLLELILFEIERIFCATGQPYLENLYKTFFSLGYYGLLRAGELTFSEHVIKAANVHMAGNKDKILIILYSSKTHSKAVRPQKIKIVANDSEHGKMIRSKWNFCPFQITRKYIEWRGGYNSTDEPFFIFSDGSPVTSNHARMILKKVLQILVWIVAYMVFTHSELAGPVTWLKNLITAFLKSRWREDGGAMQCIDMWDSKISHNESK